MFRIAIYRTISGPSDGAVRFSLGIPSTTKRTLAFLVCWSFWNVAAWAAGPLQSQYFKDDPVAGRIAAGAQTIDVNEFGLTIGLTQGDTTTFAYKVMSALRELGYIFPLATAVGDKPQEKILNKFQKDYGLPITPAISQELILKLDNLLTVQEVQDSLFPLFPLLPKFTTPPLNEPSNAHLNAVISLALLSLPANYRPWTESNFRQGLVQIFTASAFVPLASGDYQVCMIRYHAQCGPQCADLGPQIWGWEDDYNEVSTLMHEYGHYLDGALYSQYPGTAGGLISNTTEFYNLSYDIATQIQDSQTEWLFYKRRTSDDGEFVSTYALGWSDDFAGQRQYTAYEDFAESFAAYVLHGMEFRGMAATNAVLARKYAWLKSNVFQGVDFQTGNTRYQTYYPAGSRAYNIIDYQTANTEFVWDHKIALPLPVIASVSDQSGVIGTGFVLQMATSNGPSHFSVSGLPASGSLSMSPSGLIRGTPVAGDAGLYAITVAATNMGGPGLPQSFHLSIANPSPTGNLPPADVVMSALVHPNPLRAARGDTSITFEQLPPHSTVKIFTVSARWVKTLQETNGSAIWDATNDAGQRVASGFYLYVVSDSQGVKTRGKIGVIR